MPTKQSTANTASGDQVFNMFGVLLNFLVTPDETGHEISLFPGTLPPGVVIPLHIHAEPELLYVLEDRWRSIGRAARHKDGPPLNQGACSRLLAK
jgi:hypothetical protein